MSSIRTSGCSTRTQNTRPDTQVKFEVDFIVFDDEADNNSISHKQDEVLMTLDKPSSGAKLVSNNNPNHEVILTFPTRQGSSKKKDVRVLVDMCAIDILLKQSLFDLLKHETVDGPKAKTWTTSAGTFIMKKKAVISGCLLPLIMNKCCFSIVICSMPDSDQPYAMNIDRDLMH